MRKLKGVIGAIIVVIALMGSVLAGYALNVNGSTAIVNGYEKVTDVTGLYSHSQEKTFIEYNPASNYIGYSEQPTTYTNEVQYEPYKYRSITKGGIYFAKGVGLTYVGEGGTYYWNTGTDDWHVIGDGFFIYGILSDPVILSKYDNMGDVHYNTMLLDIDLPNITVTVNDSTVYYFTDVDFVFSYDPVSFEYVGSNSTQTGIDRDIYVNDASQIYGLALNDSINTWGSFNDTAWSSAYDSTTATIQPATLADDLGKNVKKYTVDSTVSGFSRIATIYPISVQSTPGLGIDYTESNRVNNYPIEYRSSSSTDTTTQQLDLQALATTDYWPQNENWIIDSWWNVGEGRTGDVIVMAPRFSYVGSTTFLNTIHKYKLSDMLPAMNLPADTTKVSMDLGNIDNTVILQTNSDKIGSTECVANFTAITTDAGLTDRIKLGSSKGNWEPFDKNNANYKIDYYPANGMCDIFSYNGVKKATAAVDSVYIQFVSASAQYGRAYFTPAGGTPSIPDIWYSPNQSRPHPFLNLEITSQTSTGTPVYMDPTKGINIKSTNLGNVTWNNEYENGIIKILFRAVETFQSYHNEFTISGNDVAVDYTDGKFSVSLNGGDPVDIGRWRNIVLDLNLGNGTLTVIPVRTLNSYTNVELDTTNIPIGELTNSTTTNTIQWKPTPNSFRFNIYSTDVFLDTYGAVMVNPTLDVQQYFTQLNNFYRLQLKGFTVVGDSLTINGITGTTSGQNVTFNDQILSLKNLDVTYADGKVTVGDGNISVDLGDIQNTVISGIGTWYFTSQLDRGFTESKQVYTWDWGDFIFNNTQFCVIFIGLVVAGLVAGRKVSSFGVADYAIIGIAIVIALTTQVIA